MTVYFNVRHNDGRSSPRFPFHQPPMVGDVVLVRFPDGDVLGPEVAVKVARVAPPNVYTLPYVERQHQAEPDSI